MSALNSLMTVFVQTDNAAMDAMAHDLHLMMWFLGVIAFFVVLLLISMCAAGIYAMRLTAKLEGMATSLHGKTLPLIGKAEGLVDEFTPKVRSIITNAEQISFTAREKVDEIGHTITSVNRTVADLNVRTQVQVARVHGIVTEALTSTEEVSRTVQDGIKHPLRKLAGLVDGFKTGFETLIAKSPIAAMLHRKRQNPYDL